jgi:hypothetical protein
MNARIVRFVAAVATAAVVSVMGAGLANASAADQMATRIATATGQQNTHSVAGYLAQMRDYLNAAVTQEDVEAVNAAIKNLRPVLGVVREAPVERAAAVLNDRADSQAAQIERDLPGLTLLAPITGLVTSLLTTILDLVTSLLGGLPLPLPVPDLPLPDLPLPELPGVPTPELPVPAPPDAPAPPEAPAPAPELPVPAPEVPPVPAP